MISQILDLQTDPNLLPCGQKGHPTLLERARNTVIKDLHELFRKDLLRAKVLVTPPTTSSGVIFYGLVEHSLCNLTGEGILHLFCLEVAQSARQHRYGKKLIHAALSDYPPTDVRGISTFSHGEYWTAESYFQKLGFEIVHQQGLLSLLFKPLEKNISPPSPLKLQLPPSDAPVVVDHFQGSTYCPFGISFEKRILSIVQDLPDVTIRVHTIQSREDVLKYGTTPARVFINGQEPTDDPTVSDEELREKIYALCHKKILQQ
jgi:hypothetical protein